MTEDRWKIILKNPQSCFLKRSTVLKDRPPKRPRTHLVLFFANLVKISVELCQFTRIPITRSNVSFKLVSFFVSGVVYHSLPLNCWTSLLQLRLNRFKRRTEYSCGVVWLLFCVRFSFQIILAQASS